MLNANVLLTLGRESLTRDSYTGCNLGQYFGPRVNNTAGKLYAQW